MRTLKFRAWHQEDKVMIYDLNSLKLNHGILTPDDYNLMQFTGLHDKDGKEIYEGDILVFKMIKHLPRYKKVIYTNGIYYAESDHLYVALDNGNILVGNIFEHPHLLDDPK